MLLKLDEQAAFRLARREVLTTESHVGGRLKNLAQAIPCAARQIFFAGRTLYVVHELALSLLRRIAASKPNAIDAVRQPPIYPGTHQEKWCKEECADPGSAPIRGEASGDAGTHCKR